MAAGLDVTMGSCVTLHMAASLDGFIARPDGSVDWMETSDQFPDGADLTEAEMADYFASVDCYVMGARTYEKAYGFDQQGLGWPYAGKPCFVMTNRNLPRSQAEVEFHSGDLAAFINERLRPVYRGIWVVGGAALVAECLRHGVADEIVYTILPVLIGSGMPFFGALPQDIPLHLMGSRAYRNGVVELRYSLAGEAVA